jgi:hypothetical protein
MIVAGPNHHDKGGPLMMATNAIAKAALRQSLRGALQIRISQTLIKVALETWRSFAQMGEGSTRLPLPRAIDP